MESRGEEGVREWMGSGGEVEEWKTLILLTTKWLLVCPMPHTHHCLFSLLHTTSG